MSETETVQLTIKSVPVKTRDMMNQLARKRGQTLGYWLAQLVDKAEQLQSGDLVAANMFQPPTPDPLLQAAQSRLIVPDAPPPLFSMADLRDTMQAMVALASASAMPVQKKTVRLVYGVMNQQLAAAKAAMAHGDADGHSEPVSGKPEVAPLRLLKAKRA